MLCMLHALGPLPHHRIAQPGCCACYMHSVLCRTIELPSRARATFCKLASAAAAGIPASTKAVIAVAAAYSWTRHDSMCQSHACLCLALACCACYMHSVLCRTIESPSRAAVRATCTRSFCRTIELPSRARATFCNLASAAAAGIPAPTKAAIAVAAAHSRTRHDSMCQSRACLCLALACCARYMHSVLCRHRIGLCASQLAACSCMNWNCASSRGSWGCFGQNLPAGLHVPGTLE